NYIHEAKMSGASILVPCVNRSEYLTTIYNDDIYLGFIHLAELEKATVEVLLSERTANGDFKNLENFIKRVSISVEQLRILIRIGAFRFIGKSKKELLWEIHSILGSQKKTAPKKELFEISKKEFQLPALQHHPYDDALDEIEILGFPLCSPFSLLKDPVKNNLNVQELIQHVNENISIIGYYVTHKRTRTIKGQDMSFGTFLDSNGYFFDTTHFPNALAKHPFIGKGCYLIKGKVVEEFGFPSIEVNYMEKLSFLNREV
ncbi:MAG: DNA polymerase III subunit alpha, partial [Bacteroidetes bacterium]|nr:DNA polymerase III subunit alpha [Bacteroidota bacterium]